MAIKNKQGMKRHRQNLKRRELNKHVKSTVRSRIRLVLKAVEEKNPEAARAAFIDAQAHLGKAGRKKVMHRRTVARSVSRLAKKVNELNSAS